MSLQLNKTQIPFHLVKKKIHERIEAYRILKGKEPTEKEKSIMKKEVLDAAKRVNMDGGIR